MGRKKIADDVVPIKAKVSKEILWNAMLAYGSEIVSEVVRTALTVYPKYKRLIKKYKKLKVEVAAANESSSGLKVADVLRATQGGQRPAQVGQVSCRTGCRKFKHGVCIAIAMNGESGRCLYDSSINRETVGQPTEDEKEQLFDYLNGGWKGE